MKKTLVGLISLLVACGLNASDGAKVFKKCVACHGTKAEKVYLNKIPALNTLDAAKAVEDMKAYKAGTLNKFKMGSIMKIQMKTLSEEDMKAVFEHIQTLK